MPGRFLTFMVPLLLVAVAPLAIGCDGGGAGDEATPTVSPAVTTEEATATVALPMTTPASDIRQQDLTDQPGLRDFLASAGGEVDASRITYADLTDDGVEEAVVPVSSGGEGGDIAVFVYGYVAGEPQELLRALPEKTRSIVAKVEEGQLVTTEGVYAPDDPFGFPSQVLTKTYRWDGGNLAVADRETAPAEGN